MNLTIVGSGSSGNTAILQNDDEALIIDCGIPVMEVKKALGFNVRKIVGALCTHIHEDHHRYVKDYGRMNIPVFEPYNSEMDKQVRRYGNFVIKAFRLQHDVPCFGFYINHPEMGNLIYATDTEYIKYHFSGINHIMVEANYCKDDLPPDADNKQHVMLGHMEVSTTMDFIKANDNDDLKDVILIHLSQQNADREKFLNMATQTTNKQVYIAKSGLEIDVSLIPECFRGI